MLFHLNISDQIIFKCIPGYVLGMSSIFVYAFLNKKSNK
jgi:hypothetical protein